MFSYFHISNILQPVWLNNQWGEWLILLMYINLEAHIIKNTF